MQLSKHFTLEELTRSDIAARKGLDNTPTEEIIANLTVLAQVLEEVRDLLGQPLYVSSGYRSPKVNSAIGGSKTSGHMRGLCADFTCPGFGSVQKVCEAIRDSNIQFDQLIFEFYSWAHIGLAERNRRQVLTARKVNGQTEYKEGIVERPKDGVDD